MSCVVSCRVAGVDGENQRTGVVAGSRRGGEGSLLEDEVVVGVEGADLDADVAQPEDGDDGREAHHEEGQDLELVRPRGGHVEDHHPHVDQERQKHDLERQELAHIEVRVPVPVACVVCVCVVCVSDESQTARDDDDDESTDERLGADELLDDEVEQGDEEGDAAPADEVEEWHTVEEARVVLVHPQTRRGGTQRVGCVQSSAFSRIATQTGTATLRVVCNAPIRSHEIISHDVSRARRTILGGELRCWDMCP